MKKSFYEYCSKFIFLIFFNLNFLEQQLYRSYFMPFILLQNYFLN